MTTGATPHAPIGARPFAANAFVSTLRRLVADPIGALGLFLVTLVAISALGADFLATHDPLKLAVRERLQAPSAAHWLGTDQLGRDSWSRILHGSRVALQIAVTSVIGALSLGTVLGLIAGYGPRAVDNFLLLTFDTIRSFPTVLFALALVTIVGPSASTIIGIVVFTTFPVYARIVRTQTLSMKQQDFIAAERALGASSARIVLSHILPNVIGPLFILASMEIPVVVTIEAGLSFLGLGIRPPTPSWGGILRDGYQFIRDTPWLAIAAGAPLIGTTLGFTFLGEALRDTLDPKLRRD